MNSLIEFGWFASHSGFQLPWKINCDALSNSDIEALSKIIRWKFAFSNVIGIPRGGLRLAEALSPHAESGYPTLIVDDVLTTGKSMEAARDHHYTDRDLSTAYVRPIGVVTFARGECPNWVWPIFQVNEWAQSRATGLG